MLNSFTAYACNKGPKQTDFALSGQRPKVSHHCAVIQCAVESELEVTCRWRGISKLVCMHVLSKHSIML